MGSPLSASSTAFLPFTSTPDAIPWGAVWRSSRSAGAEVRDLLLSGPENCITCMASFGVFVCLFRERGCRARAARARENTRDTRGHRRESFRRRRPDAWERSASSCALTVDGDGGHCAAPHRRGCPPPRALPRRRCLWRRPPASFRAGQLLSHRSWSCMRARRPPARVAPQRDCHFADVPSSCHLKRLLNVEGGAAV